MRFIWLCLLIVVMKPLPGFGQQGSSSYDLWLVRSQTITADLIKDSADLPPSERALLWARLAQRWWRDDPERARSWVLKVIEIVEAVPNKENPEERRQRLTTVRQLLPIIASLDQKFSSRLVAILTQEAEKEAKTARAGNADGLIEAAIALVDSDAKLATELGVLALRVGHPTDIGSLVWKLRKKDLRLANFLFGNAMATAQKTLDSYLLNSLVGAVFPEYYTPGFTNAGSVATDDIRRELLKVYVVYLQASQNTHQNRDFPCRDVISIAPVLVEFDRLLPQQAVIVRQSINQCQSLSPLARQRVDEALRDQPLNTVDDLLRAGDDAQDLKVRTVYQFRAAMLARQQDDFDRALKILDSMSTESREFMGGSWEAYRWDWAASSAIRHLKSGDVHGMRLIVNAVPAHLQAFARIAFVRRLPANLDKNTDPTLEFLDDARTGLRRSSVSDVEKCGWYFALLRLIVKFQPVDASAVLKEAVVALNRVTEAKDKDKANHAPGKLVGSENVSASLLEMDEYAVKEAVLSITSTDARVHIRLELLAVCLERLRSSKQTAPKPERAAPRGE